MRRPADVPAYEPDLYATQAIVDPHPHYARLRRLGPVVWLPKQRVYALPRYAQCKALNRTFNRCLAAQHSTVTATNTTSGASSSRIGSCHGPCGR